MPFEVADLSEAFSTQITSVWLDLVMSQHVGVEVAQLLKVLATFETQMGFDSTVVQNMHHQVVLGCVRLVALITLPAFGTAHLHILGVINAHAHLHSLLLQVSCLGLSLFQQLFKVF